MNPELHRREASPHATAWEWAQGGVLAVNLAWTIFGLGGYPAAVMSVTILLTGLLAAVHFLARGFALRTGPSGHQSPADVAAIYPTSLWIWPFVAYAAANVIWISPVPWLGWFDWAKWLQIAVVFWVAINGLRSPGSRRLVFVALALIAVAGVGLACYQRFVNPAWLMLGRSQVEQFLQRPSGPFGAPNSFAGLLVLLLPATAALTARRGASAVARIGWGWVTGVLLLGLALTISRGAWIALALAVTAWPFLLSNATWVRRLRLAALAAATVLAIAGAVYVVAPEARERFAGLVRDAGERSRPILWRAAWELFRAAPAWGLGAGSFDVGFERHRPEGFVDRPEWVHNDYLNTMSDYGLAGLLLLLGGAGLAARGGDRARVAVKSRRGEDWIESRAFRLALGVGVLAFALQLLVDFHLKIPALGLAFATVAGLAVNRGARPSGGTRGGFVRLMPWVAVAAAVVLGVGLSRQFRAEGLRAQAREALDHLAQRDNSAVREQIRDAQEQLRRAVAIAPGNGLAWSDLALATTLLAEVELKGGVELGRLAEQSADQALVCSGEVFEFWLRRGTARNLQGRWVEAGDDFARAIALAPANARGWFHYAEHLSRSPTQPALAAGALAFCLRLDPNCSEAIGLRQRLAVGAPVP